jgi:hypothetical protein
MIQARNVEVKSCLKISILLSPSQKNQQNHNQEQSKNCPDSFRFTLKGIFKEFTDCLKYYINNHQNLLPFEQGGLTIQTCHGKAQWRHLSGKLPSLYTTQKVSFILKTKSVPFVLKGCMPDDLDILL